MLRQHALTRNHRGSGIFLTRCYGRAFAAAHPPSQIRPARSPLARFVFPVSALPVNLYVYA